MEHTGVHTTDSSSPRFPVALPATIPKSQKPQKTAESKRSLGCLVLPLPWLPKILISLAISCPMVLRESGEFISLGARVRPQVFKAPPGGGRDSKLLSDGETPSVTLKTGESLQMLAPCYGTE